MAKSTTVAKPRKGEGPATLPPKRERPMKRLKSATPQPGGFRVLAITGLAAGAINADCVITEAQLAAEFRSTVLNLLGVEELPAP